MCKCTERGVCSAHPRSCTKCTFHLFRKLVASTRASPDRISRADGWSLFSKHSLVTEGKNGPPTHWLAAKEWAEASRLYAAIPGAARTTVLTDVFRVSTSEAYVHVKRHHQHSRLPVTIGHARSVRIYSRVFSSDAHSTRWFWLYNIYVYAVLLT